MFNSIIASRKILSLSWILVLMLSGKNSLGQPIVGIPPEEGFFYRYMFRIGDVKYSLDLDDIIALQDNEDYTLSMAVTVSYFIEKAGFPDELISSHNECFRINHQFKGNASITDQIKEPEDYTKIGNYPSNLNEFFYSRPVNIREVNPMDIKIVVHVQPRIIPVGLTGNEVCTNSLFLLDASEEVYRIGEIHDDIDLEEDITPLCVGNKLVPEYYLECTKYNLSIPGVSVNHSATSHYEFDLGYVISYECFQPHLEQRNFYDDIIARSLSGNFGSERPYSQLSELYELVQKLDYCFTDEFDCIPGTNGPCTGKPCSGRVSMVPKGPTALRRQLVDVQGHDYFVFRPVIAMNTSRGVASGNSTHNLCVDKNVIEYDENLWYSANRNCNNIAQFVTVDRRGPGNATTENRYDGLTLVKWELLQRVEQYYGGNIIPEPSLEDFQVIYTVEKSISDNEYVNDDKYTSGPATQAVIDGYFPDLEGSLAIESNKFYKRNNYYDDNQYRYWGTAPPVKIFYQGNVLNGEGEKPVFTKYQYMVRETFQDNRTADGLDIPLSPSGTLLPQYVSYRSDIISEFHAFPDVSSVDVDITYPCKSAEEPGTGTDGMIKLSGVVGGRPKICNDYLQSNAFEVYGFEINCNSLEVYETFPGIISMFSSVFDAAKNSGGLHDLFLRLIPDIESDPKLDYNYDGNITLPCGIYWVRVIPYNPMRYSYGFQHDYSRHIWGTNTYYVNSSHDPIVITPKDVAPVRLTYIPSICDNAPYLVQALPPDEYESPIAGWKWEPPKQEDGIDPFPGEAEDADKKTVFPGSSYCEQQVIGIFENGCLSKASIDIPDFSPPLLDPELLQNVLSISATKIKSTWLNDFIGERFANAAGYRSMLDKNVYISAQQGQFRTRSAHDYLDDRRQSVQSGVAFPELQSDGVIDDVASFDWMHPKFESFFPKWVNNGRVIRYNAAGQALESVDVLGNYSSALFGFDGSLPVGVAVNAKNREIGFEGFEEYAVGGSVSQVNNMMGNLDLVTHAEAVLYEKYHPYNILAGSGNYILTDIPEGKYTSEQLERVLVEVEAPAITGEDGVVVQAALEGLYKTSSGIIKDFCYDYGLMLQLPEGVPEFKSGDCNRYWMGTIYVIEEIPVESAAYSVVSIDNTVAHTGARSLKIEPCDDDPVEMEQHVLELTGGKEYIISAWVRTTGSELLSPYNVTKQARLDQIGIELNFKGDTPFESVFLAPEGAVIDGWQKLEQVFTYPEGAKGCSFVFKNKAVFYLDDIRIFPKEGNIQTYVYDPSTYRQEAVLDQNNFATIYKYDDEGKLFQVKKETVEGIKTLQVTQSYLEPRQ